jgi:hypothetical protein
VGWGVAAEKVVNLTTFSGHQATARHVGGMFGVGEKTVRLARERCHSHAGDAPS